MPKKHEKLTIDILNKTSDEDLIDVVAESLYDKIGEDYEQEYEIVRAFSKPQQAVYVILSLDGEVNNGGFNQYYHNSSVQFADLAPELLQLTGADKFAVLVAKANELYEAEYDKITKHIDGTIEGFSKSYENNPLNPLDDEFYELSEKEDLYDMLTKFIRKNKEAYID